MTTEPAKPARAAVPGDEAFALIVDAIGSDAAISLARKFGGTTLYVPREIGPADPVRLVLGEASANKLAAYCGGSRLYVPKRPERRARVHQLHRAGALTVAAIAVETGYSERHVYRLLSEHDDRQLDLFDDFKAH